MKKLSIFLVYFFISLCITAQNANNMGVTKTSSTNSFCTTLEKVMAQAYNNFKNIASNKESDINDQNGKEVAIGRRATLKIPGAIANYVEYAWEGIDDFTALFGSYSTKEQARKKWESLKIQLLPCMKDYKLIDNSSPDWIQFNENRTDTQLARVAIHIENRTFGWDTSIHAYRVYLSVFGLYKNIPKKPVIIIDPLLQQPYLPKEVKDLYIGISTEELKKRHPNAALSPTSSLGNWIEDFASGDVEQIIYQIDKDDAIVYEFIIKYRNHAKAVEIARQLFDKKYDFSKEELLKFKLKDGLTLFCKAFENTLVILK